MRKALLALADGTLFEGRALGYEGETVGALACAFGKLGDRLRGLVLHELAHVATDHAHADLLVEDLLQLFGQRDTLQRHTVELQADLVERPPAAQTSC